MLVIPAPLCRLCCRHPPPETPNPKSAEDELQEIARLPPRFRVGVVVILRRDTAAIVALPILLHNEQCADVDRRHQRHRGHRTPPPPRLSAVVATIERRRIPSAWRRRESSRRRWGLTPPHPSHTSSSVTSAAADAAADAVP